MTMAEVLARRLRMALPRLGTEVTVRSLAGRKNGFMEVTGHLHDVYPHGFVVKQVVAGNVIGHFIGWSDLWDQTTRIKGPDATADAIRVAMTHVRRESDWSWAHKFGGTPRLTREFEEEVAR